MPYFVSKQKIAMDTHKQGMLPAGALQDKVAFITGGGSGLGKSMAQYFSQLGAKVAIMGRRAEVLSETAAAIQEATGHPVLAVAGDVRKYEQIEAAIAEAYAQLGPVNILVNNAAGNFISPTERLSHRAFDAVVDIVLKGTYNCSLAFGKRWIADKTAATVLNIVTTYAWTGSPFVVPSACGKAGVLAMTRSLAVEWARYNIRFNAIAPGPFPTKGAWTRLFPEGLEQLIDPVGEIPLRRFGEHQELANLAAYLVSDYAAYINGEVITIDGGEWLQDAGQFSNLSKIPDQMWDLLERQVRGKKD